MKHTTFSNFFIPTLLILSSKLDLWLNKSLLTDISKKQKFNSAYCCQILSKAIQPKLLKNSLIYFKKDQSNGTY
jgi:hypothetical protein